MTSGFEQVFQISQDFHTTRPSLPFWVSSKSDQFVLDEFYYLNYGKDIGLKREVMGTRERFPCPSLPQETQRVFWEGPEEGVCLYLSSLQHCSLMSHRCMRHNAVAASLKMKSLAWEAGCHGNLMQTSSGSLLNRQGSPDPCLSISSHSWTMPLACNRFLSLPVFDPRLQSKCPPVPHCWYISLSIGDDSKDTAMRIWPVKSKPDCRGFKWRIGGLLKLSTISL